MPRSEIPRVRPGGRPDMVKQVLNARMAAVKARALAENAEATARALRREADSRLHTFENLLQEYEGQSTLLDE